MPDSSAYFSQISLVEFYTFTDLDVKKQPEEKFSFDQESVKEFIKKWNQGHTTIEITESMKKVELNINKSKKKVYKI